MSIQQFAKALVEGDPKSRLLEALQKLQMLSLDQLKAEDGETDDPEWAIWNQTPDGTARTA